MGNSRESKVVNLVARLSWDGGGRMKWMKRNSGVRETCVRYTCSTVAAAHP